MKNTESGIGGFQKQISEFFDISTFFIVVMLLAFGLISIFSATSEAGQSDYFYKQMIFSFIGIALVFIIMYIPEIWVYKSSYLVYGLSLVLLVAVKFLGKEISGTKGWFEFAGFSFQPSELAKLTALMAVARYLSVQGTDIKTLRDLGITLAIIAAPSLLIMWQPDFGTATVLIALLLGILFWTGFDVLFYI